MYHRVEPLSNPRTLSDTGRSPWDAVVCLIAVAGLFFLCYLGMSGALSRPFAGASPHSKAFIIRPSLLWASMGYLLLIFRTLLWMLYTPHPRCTFAEAPSLTVVIPAYNEGSMVEKAIDSVAAAQYPHDRLEVIVIDDGSKDDTWQYMQKAAGRYPQLVKTLQFKENKGKRAALAEGFRVAKGDIVVTVDSDSVIEPDALRHIAGPFRNPKVGAVAGKVVAFNRASNCISRMLHVKFILSFDFLRAVQSTYGTVYCCPGALSAYRTSVVRRVLDAWINQKFLGEQCTYGEDRSMTNFIFSCGYNSVYQRTAVVHTLVPETYSKLCKMFLRWDRSYIKEEIRLARLIWKRPYPARVIALFDCVITNLRFPITYMALGFLFSSLLENPYTLLRLLFMIGFISVLNIIYYLRSERSWDFIYGIIYSYFAFFTLFWIFPYALATLRSRSWMTR